MQLVIAALLAITGWLTSRAIALLLSATPNVVFRRCVMGLMLLFCVIPITILYRIGAVPPQFVVFAFFLSAAIGFILSQRTDRTLRIWTTLATVPFLVALAVAFVVLGPAEFIESIFVSPALPRPILPLGAFPLAFSLGLLWHVPFSLWNSRKTDAPTAFPGLAILLVIGSLFATALTIGIYDRSLRRAISSRAETADRDLATLLNIDHKIDKNLADEYLHLAWKWREHPEFSEIMYKTHWPPLLLSDCSRILDATKELANTPNGQFRLNDASLNEQHFLSRSILALAGGLISRAEQSKADSPEIVSDLVAVRNIQRHLVQDPRFSAEILERLEQRMRPAFESLQGRYDPSPLLSGFINTAIVTPTLEMHEAEARARVGQILKRRFLDTDYYSTHFNTLCDRVLFAERYLADPTPLLGEYSWKAWELSDRKPAYELIETNDAGLIASRFYNQNQRAPTTSELASLLTDVGIQTNFESVSTSRGGIVFPANRKGVVQPLLAPLDDTKAVPEFYSREASETIAEYCFLIGDAVAEHRWNNADASSRPDKIILLAPSQDDAHLLLSGIRRDSYTDAYHRVYYGTKKEHKATMHNHKGALTRVLNTEKYRLGDDADSSWFHHPNAITARHEDEGMHSLVFWSYDELDERCAALKSVRRDEFQAQFAGANNFTDPDDNENAEHITWLELSLLADFLEWANEQNRAVVCITLETSVGTE